MPKDGRWVVDCVEKIEVDGRRIIDKFRLKVDGGWDDGRTKTVTKTEAIKMVKGGTDIYVVNRPYSTDFRDQKLYVAVSDDGNEYLTTPPDGLGSNNLSGVPECNSDA